MATFGETSDGTNQSTSSANRVWVSQATPATSGTVTTGHVRLALDSAGSTSVKFAIYADSSGEPGALLAESDAITVNDTTIQWRTLTFSGGNQISVTGGTPYWVGPAWQDPGVPGVTQRWTGSAGGRREQSVASWPTLPNPYGTPTSSTGSGPLSAYVTYTEGSSSGPTVRSAAGASGAAGNDPAVVTKPAGLAVGDLLLAFHVGDNDALLANMTAPASWTEIASQAAVSGAQPAMKVWHRIATSTETAALNFSFSAGGGGVFCSAGILAITAGTFDPTAPLSPTFTINAANSTSHVAPSLTGIVNGLLVTAHSTDQGGASSTSYTPPSGMTEHVDTAASPGWTCVEVNTLAVTSTAATGTKTATCTASRPATSISLIVSPASGANIARRTGGFLQLL